MAEPKKKVTKRRRDNRRSHHALNEKLLVKCTNCGSMKLPHTFCSKCKNYS